jgi:hypothetical protein
MNIRLTFDEIRLITVILLILLVGTAVKHYRDRHPRPLAPAATPPPVVEPAGY